MSAEHIMHSLFHHKNYIFLFFVFYLDAALNCSIHSHLSNEEFTFACFTQSQSSSDFTTYFSNKSPPLYITVFYHLSPALSQEPHTCFQIEVQFYPKKIYNSVKE